MFVYLFNTCIFVIIIKYKNKMEFTAKALELIDTNSIKSDLMRVANRSYPTITRWIKNNDPQLTRKDCLSVIMKETGLTESELFGTVEEIH